MDKDDNDRDFVYVCCATENQIVNLIPLLQLDHYRVVGIFMLVGRNDPPTERDKETALAHISNFNSTLAEICKRESRIPPTCHEIVNPPNDTIGWQRKVAEKLKNQRTSTAKPILNVTSGTRSMMFGAMLGIQDSLTQEAECWCALIHLASPSRTEQLLPTACPNPGYLRGVTSLRLTDHLSLRGYQEHGKRAREKRETDAAERSAFTEYLAGSLIRGSHANHMASVLHRLVSEVENSAVGFGDADERNLDLNRFSSHEFNVFRSGRQHDSGRRLKTLFEKCSCDLYRIDSFSNSLAFLGKSSTSYFMGGWFEEYVLLVCQRVLGRSNQFHIAMGVRYADRRLGGSSDDGEIDIVIQAQNDLHLIECKSGSVASRAGKDGVDRRSVHTIATRRRQIAGPTGSARLLSFQTGYGNSQKNLSGEATHAGVTVYFGKNGLDEFRYWLQDLAKQITERV